jgi:hypothetical protein
MNANDGNMKRLPCKTFQNVDTVSGNCFYIACYSQLIINQMEKCKWSFFKFNHYFQLTETKVFQVIGKNKEEQWTVKFRVSFNWL